MGTLILEQSVTLGRGPVPPGIVPPQSQASRGDHDEEASIDPVTRRVALDRLVCRVDPHANDLARGSHGDVEGNGQTNGGRRLQVGGEPA